jgi:hypothetical protein
VGRDRIAQAEVSTWDAPMLEPGKIEWEALQLRALVS